MKLIKPFESVNNKMLFSYWIKNKRKKMGLADLHIHSMYSYDGTTSIPAILKYARDYSNLDVIAITDHNSMGGVQEAMNLADKYDLEVIPGCEVSSIDGHVLCLFIDRPVMAGLTLKETVLRTGELGGLCIAPHPMAQGVNSLNFNTIRESLKDKDVARVLVGIETFNGGLVYTRRNNYVVDECQQLPLAQLGNSDAHILSLIGQGSTLFIGSTAADLRKSLENGTTIPQQGNGLNGIGVLTSYIPHLLMRKLGWVDWNATRNSPIQYKRLSEIGSYSLSGKISA